MRAYQIVPGGERGRRSPVPGRVLGRHTFSRRLAELYRAVDWGYVRLWLAVAATAYIVVRIALGRTA